MYHCGLRKQVNWKRLISEVESFVLYLLLLQDYCEELTCRLLTCAALCWQALQLQSSIEFIQETTVDKQMIVRLEAKIRELDSRFDLEQTTRHRVEVSRTSSVFHCVFLFKNIA